MAEAPERFSVRQPRRGYEMIRKRFIAGFSALAISFAGLTAAPAQASDDTAKIIAGAAALAILGTVIAKSSKDDRRDHAVSKGHSSHYYGHAKHKHHRYKSHRGHKRHKYYGGYKRHKSYGGHKRYKHKNHRRYGGYGYKYGY